MPTTKVNSKSPTIRRILREAQELAATPSADFAAAPLETDLFEWHFTLRGPPQTAYAEGLYHGRIVLPPTYPLRPPAFRFLTPSGRFEANREICLSISGHHEETWQPAWGLRTAIVALRAFMETDPRGQLGGLDASDIVRRRLAAESATYRCATCGRTNAAILAESAAAEAADQAAGAASGAAAGAGAGAAGAATPANVVPPELKMVFRDELGQQPAAAQPGATPTTATATATPTPTTNDNARHEHTAVITPAPEYPPEAASAPTAAAAAAAPGGRVIPTPTIPTPTVPTRTTRPAAAAAVATRPGHVRPVPAVTVRPARRPSDDAVPLWVDRSIVILCVVLVAMLLRLAIA